MVINCEKSGLYSMAVITDGASIIKWGVKL